jgi:threonyl-tRNA synthetase
MKILTLHCDYIRFQALKKALKDAPDPQTKEEVTVNECLVVFTAVERGDSEQELKQMIEAVKKTASEVKTKNIVLYPYAHLSSNLSAPNEAIAMLNAAEASLKHEFKVSRAPFGYYKSFELKCKGHPLSELSKQFGTHTDLKKTNTISLVKDEVYDEKKLLHELSKTKLDTSKLKENDHRILGQRLDLFSFNEAAPGSVFWHPHGLTIFNELVNFWRRIHVQEGYHEISTPQVLDNKVWKVSGHWKHYKDNIFITNYEGRDCALKPMNCPGAALVFKSQARSYRELPLRFSELGKVHRVELSGVLNGLFRVIQFTQDDAHLYITKEQLESEILKVIQIFKKMLDIFGFEYTFTLSVRSDEKKDKYLGDDSLWEEAESSLAAGLKKAKVKFTTTKGEAKFYGPSLDVIIKDSLGREWQCSTLQLDFNQSNRFELEYTGEDNKLHKPVVLHRVVYGSLERFIGVLLEHTNGNLPLWLSPRQVRVISFTDRNIKASEKLVKELASFVPGLRIDSDVRNDTVQAKIRDAELLKINYIIVVGDKEEKSKTLAIRPRGGKPEFGVKLSDFVKTIAKESAIPDSS